MEKRFPERIYSLRKKLRLSQEALAALVDVTQRQISNYESGENEPTAHILLALADALNTSSDYIIGLTDNPDRPLRDHGSLSSYEKEAVEMLRNAHPDKRREMLRVWEVMSSSD